MRYWVIGQRDSKVETKIAALVGSFHLRKGLLNCNVRTLSLDAPVAPCQSVLRHVSAICDASHSLCRCASRVHGRPLALPVAMACRVTRHGPGSVQ